MISYFLAAIQREPSRQVPQTQPAAPTEPSEPPFLNPEDLIRDIAPPVPVPMPAWQWALIILGALAIVALIAWLIRRWYLNRPIPPPPTPRSIALRDLEALRPKIRILNSYEFSIAVSDVLKTYVGHQYGLPAREQTSPEFLAEIGHSPRFTSGDRQLLAKFLEQSDLIKFARVEADEQVSEDLLASAMAFVHGERA